MKVLHMTSALDGGGVDRILYNYCTRMLPEIQSDFLVTSNFEGILEKPLIDQGCRVFHVETIRENLLARQRHIKQILKSGRYDIVHDHSGYKSFFLLNLAKQQGIRCRIAHAHIAFVPETKKVFFERKIFTPLSKLVATHLFACGNDAAKWMWGKRCFEKGYVRIMPNGIETNQYAFSSCYRNKIRKELGIENKFVIGCIARLTDQKNHLFLLDVFLQIKKKVPESILMLVGQGELFQNIVEYAKKINVIDSVLFLGVRNDVPELLNAIDVFVLTSKYEGLPVTLVEAQANGVPVVVSDAITGEVRVNDNYYVISLSNSVSQWADTIVSIKNKRVRDVSKLMNKYDIDLLAKNQKKWYMEHGY